ncbi:type II toxin-antitoxin system HicB family antitoxin [Rhizobium sp.]
MRQLEYPILIAPLSAEDGGGFVATVPDLPGCMSDGETPEEAMFNVMDAIEEWIDASRTLGRDVPSPSRQAQRA